MDSRVNILAARIINEIEKLKQLHDQHLADFPETPENEPTNVEKAAIGYTLHNFYNGCENIFRAVSEYYENNLNSPRYHRDLLERMTLDIPKIRPRLISDRLFVDLDDFLAFRHKFRHLYSFEIEWEKEKQVLDKYNSTHKKMLRELQQFLELLDRLMEGD
jgi:hypothetical protein